mmetsp:Transcript_10437/g.43239  ORF Transcript_10437/g.43239 Transcript_10437/m.43239 type:complete len:212 (+) Transcript_10437:533-1168(+)
MTYVRGSSIVSHRSDAARSTDSTASMRRCALPLVPGPAPMNRPDGRAPADGAEVNDSRRTIVATMDSDRVMLMKDTRRGRADAPVFFPGGALRPPPPSPSVGQKSATRSTDTSRDASRPKMGSSYAPRATPSRNTARAAAARSDRMNASPPPGSSAHDAMAASAPAPPSNASNVSENDSLDAPRRSSRGLFPPSDDRKEGPPRASPESVAN